MTSIQRTTPNDSRAKIPIYTMLLNPLRNGCAWIIMCTQLFLINSKTQRQGFSNYKLTLENVFYLENTANFAFVPKLLKFLNILDLRHQFSGAGGGSTPAGCRWIVIVGINCCCSPIKFQPKKPQKRVDRQIMAHFQRLKILADHFH